MALEQCTLILPDKHLLPGWGCCKCRVYNGLQRKNCKLCNHKCCNPDKPLPEKYGLCNECGVPLDLIAQGLATHRDH